MHQPIVSDREPRPSEPAAGEVDAPPGQLAPVRMFITLLQILVGFYAINTIYNIVAYLLDPNGSFWRVTAPVFAALVLIVVWFCVARGWQQAGVVILAVSISLYDLLAYPLGYVPYYWAFWNQVLVLALLLPFTTRRTYRYVVGLTILVAVTLSAGLYFESQAYSSTAAFSSFMRNIVIGLSMMILAVVMYRVQGVLLATQTREWAARAALLQTQQNLESTVNERTFELTRANEKLSRQNALLTSLHEIRVGILNHLDLHDLMESILASNLSLLDAQQSVIHLTSDDGSRIEMFAGTALLRRISESPNTKGEGLVGMVWESGQVMAVPDYATWEHRAPGEDYDSFHACIAAPLITDGKVTGVMAVVRTVPGQPFTPDEIDMHVRLAQIASVAYDNARLYAKVRSSEQVLESRVEERTRSLQHAIAENEALREKSIADATATERSRLARELHDSVSQTIYGISLGARAAQKISQSGDDGDLEQPLSYIVALSETALAEIRALIFEMKPEGLREEGLKAAIHKHAEVLRHRHNQNVTLKLPEAEPATPLEVKYALYRVMQESTHNIIKHAFARNITIELQDAGSSICMSVRDDGCGFDPALKLPGHHGLGNMEERIMMLGGQFAIESAPGRGACVKVQVPKRVAASQADGLATTTQP